MVDGTAERLPIADGTADAVVFTLVLCTVNDQVQALAEARRVLRPGGELRVLEHVLAHEPGPLRSVQRAPRRNLLAAPRRRLPLRSGHRRRGRGAGFGFESLERFTFPAGAGLDSSVVLGRAR